MNPTKLSSKFYKLIINSPNYIHKSHQWVCKLIVFSSFQTATEELERNTSKIQNKCKMGAFNRSVCFHNLCLLFYSKLLNINKLIYDIALSAKWFTFLQRACLHSLPVIYIYGTTRCLLDFSIFSTRI